MMLSVTMEHSIDSMRTMSLVLELCTVARMSSVRDAVVLLAANFTVFEAAANGLSAGVPADAPIAWLTTNPAANSSTAPTAAVALDGTWRSKGDLLGWGLGRCAQPRVMTRDRVVRLVPVW